MKLAALKPGIHPLPRGSRFAEPYILLATWFGAGRLKPASGTIGTLAALPFAWILVQAGGAWLLTISTGLVLYLGTVAARKYNASSGDHDASAIVVDEVAGVWLALIPAALDPDLWLMAFVLFRVFDILKPWPCSRYDKRSHGGWPVMADDLWAGIYAFMGVAAFAFITRML